MPGGYIFHAATPKQVPCCEFFPMEAVCELFGHQWPVTSAGSAKENIKAFEALSALKEFVPKASIGNSVASRCLWRFYG